MNETAPSPRRPPSRLVPSVLTIAVGAVIGAGWLGQALYLRPLDRMPVYATPAQYGMPEFRPVTLQPDTDRGDDLTLNAWYVPGARSETVVLCHGRGDSRAGLLPVLRIVHELGYSALAMEFRAHGDSGGTWSSVGAAEQRDLAAALDWLDANGSGPVAAFGYSMGGCVALCVAARDERIRGVATEGAVADLPALMRYHFGPLVTPVMVAATPWVLVRTGSSPWQARPVQVVNTIAPRPLLVIHSRADEVVPFLLGEQLYAAAAEPKEFWVMEDTPHVAGVTRYAREYRIRLSTFFGKVFGAASPLTN